MQPPNLKPPSDRCGARKYGPLLCGRAIIYGLQQDLERRLLAEAQAANQVVTRLDSELQEEQPLNIATFQENLDVGGFVPIHF